MVGRENRLGIRGQVAQHVRIRPEKLRLDLAGFARAENELANLSLCLLEMFIEVILNFGV